MPLTDAETRDKKGTDESQTKAYCEYLYRRLCLLEYFHGNTNASDNIPNLLVIQQIPSPSLTLRIRPGLIPKVNC